MVSMPRIKIRDGKIRGRDITSFCRASRRKPYYDYKLLFQAGVAYENDNPKAWCLQGVPVRYFLDLDVEFIPYAREFLEALRRQVLGEGLDSECQELEYLTPESPDFMNVASDINLKENLCAGFSRDDIVRLLEMVMEPGDIESFISYLGIRNGERFLGIYVANELHCNNPDLLKELGFVNTPDISKHLDEQYQEILENTLR